MIQKVLLITAVVLQIISIVLYIYSIIKQGTRPHRVTRFVVLLVTALNFASIVAAHGNLGAQIMAGFFLLQSLLIAFLSLKKGIGGASKFDITCLLIALIGLIGWRVTNNPVYGISFAILADVVAFLPAFVKTWHQPDTESHWLYSLGVVTAVLSLAAYDITVASAFQIYLIVCCSIMLVCIYHRRLFRNKKGTI